jgi:trehalose/maltose hydrolase-like predicted phosphorylase
MDEWTLTYAGYAPDDEGLREALCTLGNGVLATRGATTFVSTGAPPHVAHLDATTRLRRRPGAP